MRNITTNECASDDERKASQGKCCKSKVHTGMYRCHMLYGPNTFITTTKPSQS